MPVSGLWSTLKVNNEVMICRQVRCGKCERGVRCEAMKGLLASVADFVAELNTRPNHHLHMLS